ncbi:integral membrane family protein [Colletotrichum orchidophilum]|uniref:Integral membrane family protein n=1 Tax=Colletotrichum orchidophilum TaxID=1209926 RepID=A0A1G4AS24_9PEZI|nr:integral membrane family protein [Colletotrichum orchidophilum]OHE91883.1 integral membrane family protein [Colletotrichum orchidophilum]
MASVDLSESNGDALSATAITFLVLSWLSVVLRCYVRAFMTKGFQADDWLMLIIFTITCSFILLGVNDGLGHHNQALDQQREVSALMYQSLATATYVLDMLFIKLSIGLFLLRLSNSKLYNWIIHISLAIITVWSVVIFFWNLFQCSPVEAQWDYAIPNSKCVSPDAVVTAAYSISAMTILSDWLYALLPIPMIWSVKMTKQAKATVIVILGLGIFASIATLIRLKFLADLSDLSDILFTGTDAMVWTLVEPGVAIVASSLVTIRPLLRAWRLSGFTSTDRTPGMSGRISGGMRSGTARSAPRDPYGTGDIDGIDTDLELGGIGRHEPMPRPNSRLGYPGPFTQGGSKTAGTQLSSDFMAPPNWKRNSNTKSEMYVIEGDKASDTWTGDRLGSPSVSSVDLDGLDAQSQHSGRVGLGGGRRDR